MSAPLEEVPPAVPLLVDVLLEPVLGLGFGFGFASESVKQPTAIIDSAAKRPFSAEHREDASTSQEHGFRLGSTGWTRTETLFKIRRVYEACPRTVRLSAQRPTAQSRPYERHVQGCGPVRKGSAARPSDVTAIDCRGQAQRRRATARYAAQTSGT